MRLLTRRAIIRAIATTTALAAAGCAALLGVDDVGYGGGADPGDAAVLEGGIADATTDGLAASDGPSVDAPIGETDAGPRDGSPTCTGDAAAFTSDPRNCGSCGHDCRGGICVMATCVPYVLADDSQVVGVAVSDTTVFWTHVTGTISACDKHVWLDASVRGTSTEPWGIAVLEGGVPVWADRANDSPTGVIVQGSATGSTTTPLAPVVGPTWVRAYDRGVYWSGAGPATGGGGGAQVGWVDTTRDAASAATQPLDLAVDVTSVYWTAADAIWVMPRGGGAPRKLVTEGAIALAVRAGNVFWLAATGGALRTCALPCTGQPQTLGPLAALGGRIAVDDTDVYVARHDPSGAVLRCSRTGCGGGAVVVKDQMIDLRDIAVDDGAVYWTNYDLSGSRGVWAVVK